MIRISFGHMVKSFTRASKQMEYSFSSSSATPKQQFAKIFLIRIQYNNPSDAYYQTYPSREQFRKQIKSLEETNQCYVLGGDQFPLQSTQFVINCDQKSLVQNFFNKVLALIYSDQSVYQTSKLVKHIQIEQVQKISEQKMKKLSYFYQYL